MILKLMVLRVTPGSTYTLGAWYQSTWTALAVPAGATALSFGTNLAAAGSLTTDDYTMTGH